MDDRISKLPDDILALILSKLKFREALNTGVLSKRWRYVLPVRKWTPKVVAPSESIIDKLFHYAISKRVQILELEFKYHISKAAITCFANFKSLRSFTLKSVDVNGDTLEFLLSNCPFLQRLSVISTDDLTSFNVSSLHLNQLQLLNCKKLRKVDIFAPKLVSFIYFGSYFELNIMSAPLLVGVYVLEEDYSIRPVEDYRTRPEEEVVVEDYRTRPEEEVVVVDYRTRPMAANSFRVLTAQLETLKLYCMSYQLNQLLQLELTSLRHLNLRVRVQSSDDLLGAICIINGSPFLQRFELMLTFLPECRNRGKMLTPPKCCTHQHLKIVELELLNAKAVDLELAIYLLENAVRLEKFIIRSGRLPVIEIAEQLETKLPPGTKLIIDAKY